MTRVGERAHPYPADGQWAEPDVDQAAELMRRVFENQDEARERGARAALDIRATHSPEVAGAAMAGRLRVIHERLTGEGRRSIVVPNVPALDVADVRGRVGGRPRAAGGNPLVRFTRRVLLKLLGPALDHLTGTDARLLDALERSDARMREVTTELERHQRAFHTESLAGFRRARAEARDVQRELTMLTRHDDIVLGVAHDVGRLTDAHRAEPYMADDARFSTWTDEYPGRGSRLPRRRAAGRRLPLLHRRLPRQRAARARAPASVRRAAARPRASARRRLRARRAARAAARRGHRRLAVSTATRAWPPTARRRASTSCRPTGPSTWRRWATRASARWWRSS